MISIKQYVDKRIISNSFLQKCLQALKPDSLPSTDSFTDDNPETDETACNTKSPNMDNRKELNLNKEGKIEKSETEIVMRPPDFTEVAKV